MGFIPQTNQARTLGEDDGALSLHKQPAITMMNGGGQTAIVPLFLHACLSISDGSSNGCTPFSSAFGQ